MNPSVYAVALAVHAQWRTARSRSRSCAPVHEFCADSFRCAAVIVMTTACVHFSLVCPRQAPSPHSVHRAPCDLYRCAHAPHSRSFHAHTASPVALSSAASGALHLSTIVQSRHRQHNKFACEVVRMMPALCIHPQRRTFCCSDVSLPVGRVRTAIRHYLRQSTRKSKSARHDAGWRNVH